MDRYYIRLTRITNEGTNLVKNCRIRFLRINLFIPDGRRRGISLFDVLTPTVIPWACAHGY
jgi:hypothetical protein